MRELLCGTLAALAGVSGLFFFKFGWRTKDRFFYLFFAAFILLGLNAIAVGVTDPKSEGNALYYLLRLLAFSIIAVAIWDKNRA